MVNYQSLNLFVSHRDGGLCWPGLDTSMNLPTLSPALAHSLIHEYWSGRNSEGLDHSLKCTVAFVQVISDFKAKSWGPIGTRLQIRCLKSGIRI